MEETKREEMIRSYVQAYNAFDINGMMKNMSENIRFENVSGGLVTMALTGADDFRRQAIRASQMFESRKQTILSFSHDDKATQAAISYHGVLAENLPNGLQKGDEIHLQGISIFRFADDKILSLTDIG